MGSGDEVFPSAGREERGSMRRNDLTGILVSTIRRDWRRVAT